MNAGDARMYHKVYFTPDTNPVDQTRPVDQYVLSASTPGRPGYFEDCYMYDAHGQSDHGNRDSPEVDLVARRRVVQCVSGPPC